MQYLILLILSTECIGFLQLSQSAPLISLDSINWLAFVAEKEFVPCDGRNIFKEQDYKKFQFS